MEASYTFMSFKECPRRPLKKTPGVPCLLGMGLLRMAAMRTHWSGAAHRKWPWHRCSNGVQCLAAGTLGQLPTLQLKVCEALSPEPHTWYFVMFNKTLTNPLPSVQLDMRVPKHMPLGQTAVTRLPFELHSSISLWD